MLLSHRIAIGGLSGGRSAGRVDAMSASLGAPPDAALCSQTASAASATSAHAYTRQGAQPRQGRAVGLDLSALLLHAWLRPVLVGQSLLLGICGGSWAALPWLWTTIEHRIETLGQ